MPMSRSSRLSDYVGSCDCVTDAFAADPITPERMRYKVQSFPPFFATLIIGFEPARIAQDPLVTHVLASHIIEALCHAFLRCDLFFLPPLISSLRKRRESKAKPRGLARV